MSRPRRSRANSPRQSRAIFGLQVNSRDSPPCLFFFLGLNVRVFFGSLPVLPDSQKIIRFVYEARYLFFFSRKETSPFDRSVLRQTHFGQTSSSLIAVVTCQQQSTHHFLVIPLVWSVMSPRNNRYSILFEAATCSVLRLSHVSISCFEARNLLISLRLLDWVWILRVADR